MAKKAQAAMEFLMTYGWAILVVLIAIGALIYFGVTKPDRMMPEKCVLSTGSGLFCAEFSASDTDDAVTLRVKNILTDSVTVTAVSLDSPACDDGGTGGVITADGTNDFVLDCAGGLASGDKIKGSIVIEYSVGAAGLAKSTSGQLQTIVP
jgi:hypothetical protein